MGALAGATLRRARGQRPRRRQPHRRSGRAPGRTPRRPGRARWPTLAPHELADADVLISSTGATGTGDRHGRRRPRPGGAATGRWSCSTSPCRGTSTRPSPRCPASRRRPRRAAGERRRRAESPADDVDAAPRRSSPTRWPATSPSSRPPRSRPTVVRAARPRRRGRRRRAARGSTPGCPTSTTRARGEVAHTVRRVVEKLLHAPTVRVKELAAQPGGDRLRRRAARAVRPRPGAAPRPSPPSPDDADAIDAPTRPGTTRDRSALGTRAQRAGPHPVAAGRRRAAAATGRAVELVAIVTEGDRSTAALAQLGGTGVFVSALRDALLAGDDRLRRALAQGPARPRRPTGSSLAAVPPREDPRDALVARDGLTLGELPRRRARSAPARRAGPRSCARSASASTSSPIRGNVDTRLGKVADGELDAVVLARAGLRRLGRLDGGHRGPRPDPDAARARRRARWRSSAAPTTTPSCVELLAALDDADTRAAVTAERALLAALEAGCSAPVGALPRSPRATTAPRCSCAARSPRSTAATPSRLSRPPAPLTGPQLAATPAESAARLWPPTLLDDGCRRSQTRDRGQRIRSSHARTRATQAAVGRVAFVGAGPGDPGLLTAPRRRRCCASADVVVADADGARRSSRHAGRRPIRGRAGDGQPRAGRRAPRSLVAAAKAGAARRAPGRRRPVRADGVVEGGAAPSRAPPCRSRSCPASPIAHRASRPTPACRSARTRARGRPAPSTRVDFERAGAAAPAPAARSCSHGAAEARRRSPRPLVDGGAAPATRRSPSPRGGTDDRRSRRVVGDAGDAVAAKPPARHAPARSSSPSARPSAQRDKLAWWETAPLYGWKVLVPRTKEQAGAMSERLRALRRGAGRGADDRGRAAAHPAADGAGDQGPGHRPLRVDRLHLDQRGAGGAREVRGVRPRRARVRRRQDRLRRRADRRRGARVRHPARSWCPPASSPPRACWPTSRRTTRCSTRSTGCCCRAPTSRPRRSPPACASAAGRSTT